MFVKVHAAVGVRGDTDRMRPFTMDVLKSSDIVLKIVRAALSSPTRFPKTRLANSTSFEDNSDCTMISIHNRACELGRGDEVGDEF